jgi:sialic acid synthase SpsE/endonuclease IV
MIIEKNISKFIVYAEDSLVNALNKISLNKCGIIFSVTEAGELEGVLTDGDFRRWIVKNPNITLDLSVKSASNKKYFSMNILAEHKKILASFGKNIKVIPLVDSHNHLVAIAQLAPAEFNVGNFIISDNSPAFIIAEIGNNHNGNIKLAYELIDSAVYSGANCVKFQMRNLSNLYVKKINQFNSDEDLGSQYTLDILSRFQLSVEEMFRLFDYSKLKGAIPLCTPWDKESLYQLKEYGMPAYKVASADLTNHDFIEEIAGTGKPMICSTGMSTESEIIETVKLLNKLKVEFILLHCNSTYPAPFKDIHLNYLDRLKSLSKGFVGYSGHERGMAIVFAAIAKGAKVIEKHFTLDKNMEGNDHRVSLLPNEFKLMVQGIREIEEAMGSESNRKISQGEMMNREILSKSLVASCDIKKNTILTSNMIDIKSPGKGLKPYKKYDLIGKAARRDLIKGDFFYLSDINESKISARNYKFSQSFGIPVRYHDFMSLAHLSNFNLLEFHLSYKDLEEPIENYINSKLDFDLIVHSPELFSGDHIMDLCAYNKKYRSQSIRELERVIQITKKLNNYFNRTRKPLIIINAGGFSLDNFINDDDKEQLYDLIYESLSQIDQSEVEIIPQTMPPFPWHFGGQRYHNLFVSPKEISKFCIKYDYRVCLDISHSFLACNYLKLDFESFLNEIAPYTAHYHIADAKDLDGEGLQISSGDIDFQMVANIINKKSPQASFIPEIWQGHKNNGEGFWLALEELERWFK